MTPAEELRAAAARIRERAERATPGPWSVFDDESGMFWVHSGAVDAGGHGPVTMDLQEGGVAVESDSEAGRADAEHIAAWCPPPALAVAALLEAVALNWDERGHPIDAGSAGTNVVLLLARAIPGGA